MPSNLTRQELSKWAGIIFMQEDDPLNWLNKHQSSAAKNLIEDIAINLSSEIHRQAEILKPASLSGSAFPGNGRPSKSFFLRFASHIPDKLHRTGLFIRPWTDFCRTCIITDDEILRFAIKDLEKVSKKPTAKESGMTGLKDQGNKETNLQRFFLELNYLIPVVLKKAGFEIIRAEEQSEINEKMVKKIARTMHSIYLHEVKRVGSVRVKLSPATGFYTPGTGPDHLVTDFDSLPEEIKFSNVDNAFHIPAKLLSIGYKIRPAGKGHNPVALHLSTKEVETMAKVEHIRWSWDKRLNGWTYGKKRDNINKIHPGLIPYEQLKDSEKEKDRELVRKIPSLLKDIGYVAYPVNPNRIRNLSYALKPLSSIHRILEETNRMNMQIRALVKLSPEVNEMVEKRNTKIAEAIREIEESYNYARHIQETFLPDNLYVRECFPESFILYKPKDIVSGDFYFFSKLDYMIIFAIADCTGHGIPGALLSTIGYGILDQAVNEIKLTDPSEILEHLYSRIHRFLRSEEGSGVNDDMDIVLCTLDTQSNLLSCSGVRNSFYGIRKGLLTEYRTDIPSTECEEEGECRFVTSKIQLRRGDLLYLFSDGFADQFGGTNHKKFQSKRFKSLLTGIHKRPMAEQGDILFEEIEKWREENGEDQTDDILVIGITI